MPADTWLVVGLGNPAGEYGGTRHNIGAAVVTVLADRSAVRLRSHKAKAQSASLRTPTNGTPVMLAIPHGYMNTSGGPVQALAAYLKIPPERLVIVHDDLDLDVGVVRLKRGGGTAGHRGLDDVARRLGTRDFLRVRVGIGRPPGRQPARDYVLKRFPAAQADTVAELTERAADAVVDLVDDGLEAAQNRHHGR